MSLLGLAMFAVALALVVATGLPTYAVLLGTSSAFALLGLALGAFDLAWLGALPGRLVGLLEHDLLQALALYALVGSLLHRLQLAPRLLRVMARALRGSGAGDALACLLLGGLTAPMNGSVGASLATQIHAGLPRLGRAGVDAAQATSVACAAATLGVVVPPSLVLILLGDALMRAHTEALNLTHAARRVVNAQDVMQAALLPGLAVLAGSLAVTWFAARGRAPGPDEPPLAPGEVATAALCTLVIVALLVLVANGRLYAVEAAASGGVLLLVYGFASRRLTRPVLRRVLDDAMALTGMVFALLVAASSFTLVLRGFGTDAWLRAALQALGGHPVLGGAAVFAVLLLGAFVLDAFEMIFLVVPLVMPPLLMQFDDAAWIAVLTLLVLQLGFLLPPFGYAVLMARAAQRPAPPVGALSRALAPYLLVVAGVLAGVAAFPQTTRWWRSTPAALAAPQGLSDEELQRALQPPPFDEPTSPAGR